MKKAALEGTGSQVLHVAEQASEYTSTRFNIVFYFSIKQQENAWKNNG